MAFAAVAVAVIAGAIAAKSGFRMGNLLTPLLAAAVAGVLLGACWGVRVLRRSRRRPSASFSSP